MELVNSFKEIIGKTVWSKTFTGRLSELHVLLRLTNSFRSTDPRDKVFALLGLIRETQIPEQWPEELMYIY